MNIRGIDFDFSTLNASDVERMLAAQETQQTRAATEGSRYTAEGSGYPDWLRFQCRIFMDYLDEVLGKGASEKLGLDGSNFNDCLAVSQAFADAMAAEKAAVAGMLHPAQPAVPIPLNREQRRAAAKAHPAVMDFRVQETEKEARRKKLMAELAALDND